MRHAFGVRARSTDSRTDALTEAGTDDPSAAGRSGLLPYIPAIDGLRALAVTAVLLYHAQIGLLSGGFIGVDIFFVISGYLITSLLLAERSGGDGRVNLIAFWGRRARRLLPALLALIGGSLLYTVIFLPQEVATLRGDAIASLGYVTNWYLIFEDQSYFEALGRPSLLQHLWSLAVEEQFYVFFPLIFGVVLARLSVRYALALVCAAAIASAALMMLIFEPGVDPSRVYYGTDTRIFVILAGVALAYLWRPGGLPRRAAAFTARTADAWGLAALVGLIAVAFAATDDGAFLYRGGFLAVAVLTSILIAAAVHPRSTLIGGILARRPLVWLGTRSYSVYLWHWPVFMLTRPGVDVAIDGVELLAVRLAVTFALAEASFRLIETPIRTGGLTKLWRAVSRGARASIGFADFRRLGATGAAVGVAVFLAISVLAADPPPLPSYLQAGQVQTISWSRAELPADSTTPVPAPTPAPIALTTSPTPTLAPLPPEPAARTATPAPSESAGPRVFALGDSVMLGAAPSLKDTIGNLEVDAAVSRQVSQGIGILQSRADNGLLGDVVVIHLGNNGYFSEGQMEEIMSILSSVDRVVFVTVMVPREWEGPNNGVIQLAAAYPNAVVVDWYAIGVGNPNFFWEDEFHLRSHGADFYAGLLALQTALSE
ncbi:MAG: acyltransferase [Chloroflexi bacterium]|nr:acyltransferase [Chloroflexota bacterium]MCI0817083.1 acyltransferase [Chloroflexota bacterium]MCI0819649.1 acyltransferase [Chloroflexota bacterium]MCI0831327.1 acyltransferase [Chloroflexota bacterium]MCI0843169.1 acyltransferase [Chloroflexota bacterium]